VLRYQLGSATNYSVCDAEAVGGILALWLLATHKTIRRESTPIYTDSQDFLNLLSVPKTKSGIHLIKKIIRTADEAYAWYTVADHRPKFIFRWISQNDKIKGNIKADEEAKEAARGGSSDVVRLPPILHRRLPFNAELAKANQLEKLHEEWKAEWSVSPRRNRMRLLDTTFPFDKYCSIVNSLTRAQGSIILQIRTQHIPLNAYLFKIKKAEAPYCQHCQQRSDDNIPETVLHYLFICPEHAAARSHLDNTLGRDSRDLAAILKDKKKIQALLKYISRTKRLKAAFGDVLSLY